MTRSAKHQELAAYEEYARRRREASDKYADDLERVHLRPKRDPRRPVQTKVFPLPGPEAAVGAFSLYPEQREKPRQKQRWPDAVDEWFRHRPKR